MQPRSGSQEQMWGVMGIRRWSTCGSNNAALNFNWFCLFVRFFIALTYLLTMTFHEHSIFSKPSFNP